MIYNYPNISSQDVFGKRFYKIDDETYFPSITTVLGVTLSEEKKESLEKWKNWLGKDKANKVSQHALRRGENVHLLIEKYLKNETIDIDALDINSLDYQLFNSLKLKLKPINKIYGQEVVLYSSLLEIAGRCDFIGEYNNLPIVADWKTSTKTKSLDRIHDYFLQACFYAIAHNEMFNTKIEDIMIFVAVENGLPQIFKQKINNELVDELIKRKEKFYKDLVK